MAGIFRRRSFAQYVFGPDRATMLKTQLPAERHRRSRPASPPGPKGWDKRRTKIETAQQALVTELETPCRPR